MEGKVGVKFSSRWPRICMMLITEMERIEIEADSNFRTGKIILFSCRKYHSKW